MPRRTFTFEMRTNRPDRLVEMLARQVELGHPASLLLFVSGELAPAIPGMAKQLAAKVPTCTCLILPTVGVLTERGEIEGGSAAAALLLKQPMQVWTSKRGDPAFGQRLCRTLDQSPGAAALVALGTGDDDDGWLEHVGSHFRKRPPPLFGGGLVPGQSACAIDRGQIQLGAVAAAVFPPNVMARFRASSACRLISPLRQVTKSRGPVLHEVEGMMALDRLSEATSDLTQQPLVLLAVATGENPLSRQGRSIALRTIQGVDPGRGTLIFAEQIPEGSRVAFAVRDAYASRQDLQAQMTSLRLECAGSAPEFGIVVNCAARGRGLYGADDVDLRIIKKTFPSMPLVGMHSTFELAPLGGRTIPQIYNAVMGVFCSPS